MKKYRISISSGIYLVSIIVANLVVQRFGPSAAPYVAFVLIGLDLSLRDKIHDGIKSNLVVKMLCLILLGSAVTFALNQDAYKIAIASSAAFMAATAVDAIAYHLIKGRPFIVRSNTSNFFGALIDSGVFITLAFGFIPSIFLLQVVAKVAGGFVWSLALKGKLS